MNILVIDGMGGGIGKAVIEELAGLGGINITAAGTNSAATQAMLRAGATNAATGENAVCHNAALADYIIGPMGIIAANAMHGEVSPKMALAVSQSRAHKILIPIDKCNITVVGVASAPLAVYLGEVVKRLEVRG